MSRDSAAAPPSLPGRCHRLRLEGRDLEIALYAVDPWHDAGPAAVPLLLVHSINAAASAFEMLPLALAQAPRRPVIALDLPGFGASDKPDIAYTPALMAQAVQAAVRWIGQHVSPQPLDLVALSLGGEFATEAVLREPQRFRSLALISPTAMERRRHGERYEDGRSREQPALRRRLRGGAFGRMLFRALTSRPSMRFFLAKTWGRSDFDRRLLDHGWQLARLPGAAYAPLDFVSGALFTRGVIERYRALPVPVWVSHGTRGSFADFDACPEHTGGPLRLPLHRTTFDGGAMPHFEHPQAFAAAYDDFLAALAPTPARSTILAP